MKNFTIIIVLLSPLMAMAQIEKGTIFLGGTASWSTVSSNPPNSNGRTFNTSISPQVGGFISSKNALGGGLTFSRGSSNGFYNEVFTIDAFHRFYVPITSSFYFIIHSEIDAGFGKAHNDHSPSASKHSSLSILTGPRFALFPSRKWSLEMTAGEVGFSNSSNKSNGVKTTFGTSRFQAYATLQLGVFYYFRK